MNQYNKLKKNTIVLTIGNFSSKFMSYILVPLYTYALSTSEYGVVDLISTTVSLLIPVMTLVVSESVMRYALDNKYDRSQVFSIGIYITVASCLIFLMLYPFINRIDMLGKYFLLFYGVYVSHAVTSIVGQFVKGIEKIKTYTIAGVVQTFSFLVINIVALLILRTGVTGYLLSNILSNCLGITILAVGAQLHRFLISPNKLDLVTMKEMLGYSIPLIPNNISWWISDSSDKYILALFYGAGVVGMYSTAYKIPSIMQVFTTIFWSAWQISAVENFGSKESEIFFGSVYRNLSSLFTLVCAFVICASEFIAFFAFQNEFFRAWTYSPLLILGFLFSGLSSFLGSVYTSAKKTRMIFVSTICAACINIALNFVLIPPYGGYGAAIATLLSYFAIWLFRIIDTRKILKIEINLKKDAVNYLVLLVLVIITISFHGMCRSLLSILLVSLIIYNERSFINQILKILKVRYGTLK